MFTPLHNDMTAALAELRSAQERINDAVAKAQEVTATAATKDKVVSATVDGHGRLTGVTFRGSRWRDLAPKELGARIVEAVTQAQDEAAATTAELMSGLVPNQPDLAQFRDLGPQLDAMFDAAVADEPGERR